MWGDLGVADGLKLRRVVREGQETNNSYSECVYGFSLNLAKAFLPIDMWSTRNGTMSIPIMECVVLAIERFVSFPL